MANVSVYNIEGKEVGTIDLNDAVFGVEVNEHLVHMAVVSQLANKRQGTQKAKTRSEVSGGGRKPWRQKGTGHPRQGSTRAPQWTGGGVVFAPTPRDYSFKLNKKEEQAALKSALTSRVEEKKFIVVDEINFDEIKTKKFHKVVMNLLSNAFKFTPDGGRVDVALEMSKEMSGRLLIKVSDTGVGIRDEDKERIFERFYQVEQEEPEHQSTGSGIGLSLVRDFVTLHEGTVRVVDNVGSGSVFLVELPVKHVRVSPPKPAPLTEEVEEHEELLPGMEEEALSVDLLDDMEDNEDEKEKPLALIVDDNEDLVAFMKDSLSLYFRIQSASNGREAWQKISELMPDIIVSDVMMPEMDGNELCRWVKTDKRTSDIPMILLTARQAVEDKVEGLTIGADDYVTKPFNVEILILRMRKLIDLSKKRKAKSLIDPEPSEIAITSLDEKLVENAIKYVEANIGRCDLSVEELSRGLGMSRVHLYKKLLQITGKTPIEFIRVIRLKRAAQMLRESQQNVSEIAYQLGFNNPKYFSKYFKDEFGVLPSVYQEREGR